MNLTLSGIVERICDGDRITIEGERERILYDCPCCGSLLFQHRNHMRGRKDKEIEHAAIDDADLAAWRGYKNPSVTNPAPNAYCLYEDGDTIDTYNPNADAEIMFGRCPVCKKKYDGIYAIQFFDIPGLKPGDCIMVNNMDRNVIVKELKSCVLREICLGGQCIGAVWCYTNTVFFHKVFDFSPEYKIFRPKEDFKADMCYFWLDGIVLDSLTTASRRDWENASTVVKELCAAGEAYMSRRK